MAMHSIGRHVEAGSDGPQRDTVHEREFDSVMQLVAAD
jgi:hypothetical protein